MNNYLVYIYLIIIIYLTIFLKFIDNPVNKLIFTLTPWISYGFEINSPSPKFNPGFNLNARPHLVSIASRTFEEGKAMPLF